MGGRARGALAVAVLLCLGAGAVAAVRVRDRQVARGARHHAPATTTTRGSNGATGDTVPAPGFTHVEGTATAVHLAPTLLDEALGNRVHVELLERGAASASVTGARVDGRGATIAWSGGTPLDLTGPGSAVVTPVTIDADGAGILARLDGASLRLDAGRWHLTGPVAVGSGGLAAPRDSVDFEAPEALRLDVRGGAGLRYPPAERVLEGPGAVVLRGDFATRTTTASGHATAVRFPPGPYRVRLSWVPRFTVAADFQGAVEIT